jgi:hypothetical protein
MDEITRQLDHYTHKQLKKVVQTMIMKLGEPALAAWKASIVSFNENKPSPQITELEISKTEDYIQPISAQSKIFEEEIKYEQAKKSNSFDMSK